VQKTTYLCINNVVEISKGFSGLYKTAEAASAVYIRPWKPYISNNYLDFLGKFEAIFETALALESGP
jgi:hypothetical protein